MVLWKLGHFHVVLFLVYLKAYMKFSFFIIHGTVDYKSDLFQSFSHGLYVHTEFVKDFTLIFFGSNIIVCCSHSSLLYWTLFAPCLGDFPILWISSSIIVQLKCPQWVLWSFCAIPYVWFFIFLKHAHVLQYPFFRTNQSCYETSSRMYPTFHVPKVNSASLLILCHIDFHASMFN